MQSTGTSTGPGREYYDQHYPDYIRQNSPDKLAFYLSLVRRWTPRGASLFELGVGLGVFLEQAAAEYACSGSDINAFGVAETRLRVPGAHLSVGSHQEIPTQPAPSAVVAWDVLEHLSDLGPALDTIHARLAPGGVLIAVVPVYDGPLGWLVELLDRDETHVSKWSRGRWLDTLRQHGFEVVDHGGIIRRLLAGRYLHLTGPQWLLRGIGSALYFVARKPL